MNLQDLVDDYGLQQDEWSLTAPKFGKEGQLEVIGWSGRNSSNSKYYLLKCSDCSKDEELLGQGYFKSLKRSLLKGYIPCACSKNLKWSKEQFTILCSRKAEELGYKFLGFVGDWRGVGTKTHMECPTHGLWSTGCINTLTSAGGGCPSCRYDKISAASTKPDYVIIQSFFDSKAFHPETKFWRSERKTKQGIKSYWHMSCPDCGRQGESQSGNLRRGQRPCMCSTQRQQEGYINWLLDEHNTAVAIKFGVAKNSKNRLKQQNLVSAYKIHQHSVYTFADVLSCKKAELECKKELECGIVLKRDMPDGYTETTWVYNLEKIVEIYERNGGVRVECSD